MEQNQLQFPIDPKTQIVINFESQIRNQILKEIIFPSPL